MGAAMCCVTGEGDDLNPGQFPPRHAQTGGEHLLRRLSTVTETEAVQAAVVSGGPSRAAVKQQRLHASRAATIRRYSRTGSRLGFNLEQLMRQENGEKKNVGDRQYFDDMRVSMMRLDKRLGRIGFKSVTIGDDGNCQFRALSWQLYNDQRFHGDVRMEIVAWIGSHRDFFGVYFDGDAEFNEYLRNMAKNRTWGDELTLRAACDRYKRKIHIITTDEEHWYIRYEPTTLKSNESHAGHIFLTYIAPIHYNTVEGTLVGEGTGGTQNLSAIMLETVQESPH